MKAASINSGGFTLIEVMVVMALMTMLFVSVFGAITSMNVISRRSADVVAGMELAEAKIHDIRATNYPGTNGVFSSTSTTTNINDVSVSLNEAGTTLAFPGKVISTIAPIAWGHLVTVQVIIREPNRSLTNTLQTVVNSYSGGRG
jgi:prepilin-type N-terminal cleavage/methylation domain-containing protein